MGEQGHSCSLPGLRTLSACERAAGDVMACECCAFWIFHLHPALVYCQGSCVVVHILLAYVPASLPTACFGLQWYGSVAVSALGCVACVPLEFCLEPSCGVRM